MLRPAHGPTQPLGNITEVSMWRNHLPEPPGHAWSMPGTRLALELCRTPQLQLLFLLTPLEPATAEDSSFPHHLPSHGPILVSLPSSGICLPPLPPNLGWGKLLGGWYKQGSNLTCSSHPPGPPLGAGLYPQPFPCPPHPPSGRRGSGHPTPGAQGESPREEVPGVALPGGGFGGC